MADDKVSDFDTAAGALIGGLFSARENAAYVTPERLVKMCDDLVMEAQLMRAAHRDLLEQRGARTERIQTKRPNKTGKPKKKSALHAILDRLQAAEDACMNAVAHVGQANYAERQEAADEWVEKAFEDLREILDEHAERLQ